MSIRLFVSLMFCVCVLTGCHSGLILEIVNNTGEDIIIVEFNTKLESRPNTNLKAVRSHKLVFLPNYKSEGKMAFGIMTSIHSMVALRKKSMRTYT